MPDRSRSSFQNFRTENWKLYECHHCKTGELEHQSSSTPLNDQQWMRKLSKVFSTLRRLSVGLAAGIVGRAEPVVQHNSQLTGAKYYKEIVTQNTPFVSNPKIWNISVFGFSFLTSRIWHDSIWHSMSANWFFFPRISSEHWS